MTDPAPITALADRRVAISHEWLTIPGGSEKVVLALLDLLPHAEILTTVYDPDGPWPRALTDRPIHPSFLDRLPGAREHYPKLLPLMDRAFRGFDVSGYDLVVSSNHANAKNVRTHPRRGRQVRHVCYCHTPMRYAWDPSFLEGEDLGRVGGLVFRALLGRLRRADLRGARQVDEFVANSTFVAERIRSTYGVPAHVVHPPVDVDRFLDAPRVPEDFYLVFGRVVPYKKADVAAAACELLGRDVVIAGTGRDLDRVRAVAGSGARFPGRVDDAEVASLFSRARALLFPGTEDFGIVPVEAQAAGLPVIAYGVGGARDSVVDGVTGVLYDDPSPAGLAAAIERFEGLTLRDEDLRAHARGFAPEVFRDRMAAVLTGTAGDQARP
ncbi:glycosyltransferase [Conexibacter sp. W3-3-2]|uniref:glycosyltransferase n=1 Tax=Conexibacter sp. W3-3-2 TaxID=2675227 RepID=UPI0012B95AEF|nr:glycosyltransferase [Conexibacter sp. W3-3-2]MTD44743.1 glycosyltransferase [Conexibacter sp. W3-3-2]